MDIKSVVLALLIVDMVGFTACCSTCGNVVQAVEYACSMLMNMAVWRFLIC